MLSKRGDGGESGGIRRFTPPANGGDVGGGDGGGGGGGDPKDKARLHPGFIAVIEKAARRVAQQFGFSPEDTEDFCQAALVYVMEKPQILEDYQGTDHCSLAGYLMGVLRNYALDIYRQRVGKWHSSANAKRLGPEAELLEALRYRDHREPEAAITKLLEKFPQLTRRRALQLDELLKPRGLREWVGDGPLEKIAAQSHADEGIEAHELEVIEQRVQRVLREVLAELPVADRVMVKAIFGKGQSIKDFALFQGMRQRQMYSHFDRLRLLLRKRLESEGITAEDALRIIGWSDSALHLDLDSGSEIPDDRRQGPDPDDPDREPDG